MPISTRRTYFIIQYSLNIHWWYFIALCVSSKMSGAVDKSEKLSVGKNANIEYTRCNCHKPGCGFLYYQADYKLHFKKVITNAFISPKTYDFAFKNKWNSTFFHLCVVFILFHILVPIESRPYKFIYNSFFIDCEHEHEQYTCLPFGQKSNKRRMSEYGRIHLLLVSLCFIHPHHPHIVSTLVCVSCCRLSLSILQF